jgi:NAD(P)-dependent dehydrogenase (short-subunit alcohol dehydrogenase family)
MINLNPKVYLVTGGSSGIGLEVCKKLLHSGAKVYCGSRSNSKYKENLYSWALGEGLENNVNKSSRARRTCKLCGNIISATFKTNEVQSNNGGFKGEFNFTH